MSLIIENPSSQLIMEIGTATLILGMPSIVNAGGSGGNADTLNGQAGSYYLNRTNHTGTQAISTVSGLEEALDSLAEADSDLAAEVVAIQNTLPLKADLVGGVVPTAQIPAIAITELLTLAGGVLPASEAQMLTLRGQTGDFTIRTDVSTQYIIVSGDGSLIGNWLAMPQAASPVLSVNGQTGVVVLSRANIGINSSDDIPEGVSNLYWNAQRTRDTTITGFTATNSPIISTDTVLQALGKAQGQINAISGINSDRTLLYTTPTANKPITNTTINAVENLAERLFDANYTITANTLAVGDVYELEATVLIMRGGTAGNQSVVFLPYVNGAQFSTSAATSSTVAANGSIAVDVKLRFLVRTIGTSGQIVFGGSIVSNAATFAQFNVVTQQTYNTTANITLNVAVRLTIAPTTGDVVVVKSARLFRLSNPS